MPSTEDLMEQRLHEMKLVRSWLSQNVAILDATIATMEVGAKAATLMGVPLVNPMQWWLDILSSAANGGRKK